VVRQAVALAQTYPPQLVTTLPQVAAVPGVPATPPPQVGLVRLLFRPPFVQLFVPQDTPLFGARVQSFGGAEPEQDRALQTSPEHE